MEMTATMNDSLSVPELDVMDWLLQVADKHGADDDMPSIVPVAFVARTSDEERQDPTLSIPRQLDSVRAALPPGLVIVAHFYDVESGRTALHLRGHREAHKAFDIPVPRDGGIADMLAEAQRPDRRFVAVACESVERIARITTGQRSSMNSNRPAWPCSRQTKA
jgi:hypothetical protein